MHVLNWVIVVGALAVTASLMMLACTFIGVVLQATEKMIISTRWFILVRRYGLRRALQRSLSRITNMGIHKLRIHSVQNMKPVLAILIVPIFGFGVAAFLPFLIATLLSGDSLESKELVGNLNDAGLIAGILGAVIAVYVWLQGLSYVAGYPVRGRSLPQSFPAKLSRAARDDLALNIYWYWRIYHAEAFSAFYPWLLFIIIIFGEARYSSGSASNNPQSPQLPQLFLEALVLVTAISITLIPASLTARPIRLRLISVKVCEELCRFIDYTEDENSSAEEFSIDLMRDPLGRRRKELVSIARHLADTARQLDARQSHGMSPHPLATLLRGVSHSIQAFLANERSLQSVIPDDITQMFATTLALFVAHYHEPAYRLLSQQINVFDEHGNPVIDVTAKPPSRIASFASRMVAGIPKITLAVTGLASIAAIIIAVALTLIHEMKIIDLLHYLG